MKKRLFVAIDMPADIIKYLQTIQHNLVALHDAQLNLVSPDHMHVTLSFMGDVDVRNVSEIVDKLHAFKAASFSAALGTLGVFPSQDFISVIWCALDGGKNLVNLAHAIDRTMSGYAQHKEHEFVSHITLARVKSVADKARLNSYIQSFHSEPHAFQVKEFVLKESMLTSHGPVHTTLETFALR